MIAELEKLDRRGRQLTAEEEKLAQLMTVLIQQFEEAHYGRDSISTFGAVIDCAGSNRPNEKIAVTTRWPRTACRPPHK